MVFLAKMCVRLHLSSVLCYCLILLCSVKLNEGTIIIRDGDGKLEEFSYELWSFGASIPLLGIEGVTVSADPLDACLPISEPPNVNYTLNWFVLIAGNSCDYDTKVFHSQLAGYSVAIIFKSEGNNTDVFKHLDYIPNIPALIIRESTAYVIQEHFLYFVNKSIRVFIASEQYDYLTKCIIMCAVCGGVLAIVSFSLKLGTILRSKWLSFYNRIKASHLKHLQISLYKRGDPYETCAICLEDFKIKEKLRILPCLHGYHVKCIDPWLIGHQRTCPVCKQRVYLVQDVCEFEDTETTPLINNIRNPSEFVNRYNMTNNSV